MIDQKVSRYHIVEELGSGGMGEVYLAEDTSLGRKVALKFVSPEMAGDPVARKRLLREARSAAALDHPYICKIYEVGEAKGKDFISMEYVQGQTLRDVLSKGFLDPKRVLQIALEVAEALEEAHKKGIVHRDLKPSNIMLTEQGHAKVLDFGLAKLLPKEEEPEGLERTIKDSATEPGTLQGTIVYMSPEQLRGSELDTRTDIFSFGVILFEMLSGVHPFRKSDVMSTASSILKDDLPSLTRYLKEVPPLLQHTVSKMLGKDRNRRYQCVDDVRIDLEQLKEEHDSGGTPSLLPSAGEAGLGGTGISWTLVSWVVVGVVSLVALILVTDPLLDVSVGVDTTRFVVPLPERVSLDSSESPVISPDGRHIAFAGSTDEGGQMLWVHSLDSLIPRALAGTEGARFPFWSPDGRYIAFFAGETLRKIEHSGGSAQILCEVPLGQDGVPSRIGEGRGGIWGPHGAIAFGTRRDGLYSVSEAGGVATPLTSLDSSRGDLSHRWPHFLPDGRHFLFVAEGPQEQQGSVYLGSLDSTDTRLILNDWSNTVHVRPGYLLFVRDEMLMAQPFDVQKSEVTEQAFPMVEPMGYSAAFGLGRFSTSEDGVLAYHQGLGHMQLVWVDQQGEEEALAARPGIYRSPQLSPDGTRLVITVEESGNRDVWTWDLSRETLTRVTFDAAADTYPLWTPDGSGVVFRSTREGALDHLFWKAAGGIGQARQLTTDSKRPTPYSFSPDGTELVFAERSPETKWDLYVMSMEGGRHTSRLLLQTPFDEMQPVVSPDGRWIAYMSDESGRREVYARPFPKVETGKWQISRDGGFSPVWGREGTSLFYRSGEAMMMVTVGTSPDFRAGNPEVLFTGRYFAGSGRQYDISPDGRRFLMLKEAERAGDTTVKDGLITVLNWFEELKRLAPSAE